MSSIREIGHTLSTSFRRWLREMGLNNDYILDASTVSVEEDIRMRHYIIVVDFPHFGFAREVRISRDAIENNGEDFLRSSFQLIIGDIVYFLHDPNGFRKTMLGIEEVKKEKVFESSIEDKPTHRLIRS